MKPNKPIVDTYIIYMALYVERAELRSLQLILRAKLALRSWKMTLMRKVKKKLRWRMVQMNAQKYSLVRQLMTRKMRTG